MYVYLLYMWGVAPRVTTNKSNLTAHMHGLRIEWLPETIRHAITIVRRLNIRYLWVDALCIVQDSWEDWANEAARIHTYLSNTALVLSAAAGGNAGAGIFHTRPGNLMTVSFEEQTPTKDCLRGEIYIRTPLESARQTLEKNVLRRAWMIQEVVIPNRVLIWGAAQNYWNCWSASRSEGSTLIEKPLFGALNSVFEGLGETIPEEDRIRRVLNSWYAVCRTLFARAIFL
jgi:hypothetical protein